MWKNFLDTFVKLVTYIQRNAALEKKVNEQEHEIKQLTAVVQRLAFELQRVNDKADNVSVREASERELLLLKVENQLLKAGHRLPPTNSEDKK